MQVSVFESHDELSNYVAEEMIQLLQKKANAVICLASGDSPKLSCELFVQKAVTGNINTSEFFFIGLDEWVGLSPDVAGCCRNDFQYRIIEPLHLKTSQCHFFDAMSKDLSKECSLMNTIIEQKGGIDLMIVGIGMNGHIGFNEPGVDFTLLSHVTDLDTITITVGQKYFKQPVKVKQGITLGLAQLMAARKVFLLANGIKKAPVIKKAVEEITTNQFPASIIQQHANSFALIDKEAASLLTPTN